MLLDTQEWLYCCFRCNPVLCVSSAWFVFSICVSIVPHQSIAPCVIRTKVNLVAMERSGHVRFQEHFHNYKYVNYKSKFAQRLLDNKHSIGPVENIMHVIHTTSEGRIWCDFDRASSLICGNKMPTRCNRGFYCRSYCLLNMFRA